MCLNIELNGYQISFSLLYWILYIYIDWVSVHSDRIFMTDSQTINSEINVMFTWCFRIVFNLLLFKLSWNFCMCISYLKFEVKQNLCAFIILYVYSDLF